MELLAQLASSVDNESVIHGILGSGLIVSLIGAGAAFGKLRADNNNVKESQKEHDEMDNERFEKLDNKLADIHEAVGDIKVFMGRLDERSKGNIKTRIGDSN